MACSPRGDFLLLLSQNTFKVCFVCLFVCHLEITNIQDFFFSHPDHGLRQKYYLPSILHIGECFLYYSFSDVQCSRPLAFCVFAGRLEETSANVLFHLDPRFLYLVLYMNLETQDPID